ncbi:MAG TPA: lamin tail domain-containing protein [Candidatus Paceibacterota bacterium]
MSKGVLNSGYGCFVLLIPLGLTFLPLITHAQLVISEVMYDASGSDTDREWVEIYNKGTTPIKIITGSGGGSWRFVDTSPHVLNSDNSDTTIGSGEYAIIAKNASQFRSEWPAFDGLVFSSSISLPNTSATISIKDGDQNIPDFATYSSSDGANGDGNTLHRSGTSWITGLPTPGTGDSGSATPNEPSPQLSNPNQISSPPVLDAPFLDRQTKAFAVVVSKERNGAVNMPVYFVATTDPASYESKASYVWSYGDGATGVGQSVEHSYLLPGKYVASVRASAPPGFVVANVTVNVTDLPVSFGEIKEGLDGYITLINSSAGDLYLSDLKLTCGPRTYNFPPDFVLGTGPVRLPARITGLSMYPGNEVELRDSLGKILVSGEVAKYEPQILASDIVALPPSLPPSPTSPVPIKKVNAKIVLVETLEEDKPLLTPAELFPVSKVLVIPRKVGLLESFVALPRHLISSIIGVFK